MTRLGMGGPGAKGRRLACALVALLAAFAAPSPLRADQTADAFMETLDARGRNIFETWLSAQAFYDFELDAYWREVSDKRTLRRAKKGRGETPTVDDYVTRFPPEFKGSALPPELVKK